MATSVNRDAARQGAPATPRAKRRKLSPFWAKQLHTWHWMSSAICLVGMLLFAFTGITLNHAGVIEGAPQVTTVEKPLPADLRPLLATNPAAEKAPVPPQVAQWAKAALGAELTARPAEWNEDEVYVALPQPGGDGWVTFDRATGAATYEHTSRGWISWLNDLHKGRNTGTAWAWFIDIFAAACVIFSLTGLLLLQLHARHRKSTWPIVGAGLVLPLLLIILFVHA